MLLRKILRRDLPGEAANLHCRILLDGTSIDNLATQAIRKKKLNFLRAEDATRTQNLSICFYGEPT